MASPFGAGLFLYKLIGPAEESGLDYSPKDVLSAPNFKFRVYI